MSRPTWWMGHMTRSDEDDGPYGCCGSCVHRRTDECDYCEEADLFQVDEELFEEQQAA